MRGIQGRLLRAFLGIIAILVFADVVLFGVNLKITEDYKAISDVMIAEYRLVENASTLIDAFNVYVQSAGVNANESEQEIQQAKKEIEELTYFLDTGIQDTQSKSNYVGFKSSVEQLTHTIDESIERFKQDNISGYFSDYNEANKQYGFVRDNGSTLIFGQLKYSSEMRDAINTTRILTTASGVLLLFVIIAGCIVFVIRFSRQLTRPLTALTNASKEFSSGNMNIELERDIMNRQDEIGTLAQSFNSMEVALRNKIVELNKSNAEIAKSAEDIAQKNDQLTRLNKFMVDREVKMTELKQEIKTLKETFGKTTE